jgi:hypothetical protein
VRGEAIIGVLDDEMTGVARKRPILDLALCAGTDANHFGDINDLDLTFPARCSNSQTENG